MRAGTCLLKLMMKVPWTGAVPIQKRYASGFDYGLWFKDFAIKNQGCTHQYSSGGGLTGDEFAGPVLGLGHEGALELLFALPRRLLLLLLGIVGCELRLLAAADKRARAPYQHHQQAREESEDRRQEEAPPFSDTEAVIFRDRRGSRLFLGRSHSPRARGIQSSAPCTLQARALARRSARDWARPAPPRAVDAARSIRARVPPPALPTRTAHANFFFSSTRLARHRALTYLLSTSSLTAITSRQVLDNTRLGKASWKVKVFSAPLVALRRPVTASAVATKLVDGYGRYDWSLEWGCELCDASDRLIKWSVSFSLFCLTFSLITFYFKSVNEFPTAGTNLRNYVNWIK